MKLTNMFAVQNPVPAEQMEKVREWPLILPDFYQLLSVTKCCDIFGVYFLIYCCIQVSLIL
jgi:hypothetical protein